MTRIEQASDRESTIKPLPARKRRAHDAMVPLDRLPDASTNPGESGADETEPALSTTSSVFHRQSTRAVQHEVDIHFDNDSAADQATGEAAADVHMPDPQPIPGQTHFDAHVAHPGMDASGDSAQVLNDIHSVVSPVIARIQQLWRMRQRWHRAEKSLILQGKAVCRSWTGGDKDEANKLFDAVQANADEIDPMLEMALQPFLAAIEQFEPTRKAIEKELRRSAQGLAISAWVREVKGFGDLNLAALIGECGDIGGYRNPSCLWKRMGLAVIDGERQRRKTDAEAALIHGYNPSRRAVAYLLGDCLIKGNGEGKYRQLYLQRKEFELQRVETKGHAHNRAARYMVKRVLKDLWQAWRNSATATVRPLADPVTIEFEPHEPYYAAPEDISFIEIKFED